MLTMSEQKRDFKGVWIPKNIWLDHSLTPIEKLLLSEIDSLDTDAEKGCFASNEYFGKFFRMSEGRIANLISGLRKRGYLVQVFFDGRNRGVRLHENVKAGFTPDGTRLHENVKADFTKRGKRVSRKREHNNTVINPDDYQQQHSVAAAENSSNLEEERKEKAPPVPAAPPAEVPAPSNPWMPLDLDAELKAIGEDFSMRENLQIIALVPVRYFDEYLQAFSAQELTTGTENKTRKQLRTHFYNFCRRRYRSELANPTPTTSVTSSLPSSLRGL